MNYQKINNLTGWIVFAIATAVYVITAEPTTSFWDCGEFISACYRLQVVHPPGAPLFLLIGRIFTLFAGDASNVAFVVNLLSGLSSSFTILFLFWTITALGKKTLLQTDGQTLSPANLFALMGAGAVGALAYTFSDSFWFSAVEGEVYAMSSFFTAIVFWAILKWEAIADHEDANKWLLLIAYLMGLSTGVHLLNLLCIPAICFVYYFRKFKPSAKGVLSTLLISILILGIIQYGIISYTPFFAAKFELLFVNSLSLPFNSGALTFLVLLFAALASGIYYTQKTNKVLWNTVLLGVVFIYIGYGSYLITVVRSNSNTAIDMNNPEDVFNLSSYINREQYGDRPLAYGPYFTAEPIDQKLGATKYRKGKERYEEAGTDISYVYPKNQQTLFPRAFAGGSITPQHKRFYQQWMGLKEGEKPTFIDNIKFLFTFQFGHSYFRYFFWNFVGRQNDIQSSGGEKDRGQWISGISFLDDARLGSQDTDKLPTEIANNKARNTYFFLPFLLGLVGLLYQYQHSKKNFWVVMTLFLLTGLAVIVYLNVTPLQPRERDYAYVGSFYAFGIWIGFGSLAVFEMLKNKISPKIAAPLATTLCLLAVPTLMAQQNWDDHNRANKYTARDFALDYLESCDKNAILFTMGDNDTYPLWYAQEVEGIRKDVRIINLSLLGTDWYINQLRYDLGNGGIIKLTLPQEKVTMGVRDYVQYYDAGVKGYQNTKDVVDFIGSDSPEAKLPLQNGGYAEYLPSKQLRLPVDSLAIVKSGLLSPENYGKIIRNVDWDLPKNSLYKNDLMVLDIISANNWQRPIYFTISMGPESYLGLQNHFQLEGLTYKLVPIKTDSEPNSGAFGLVDGNKMYDNMMKKFKWGNMDKGIYIDPETSRMTLNMRSNFVRLADELLAKGDKKRAIETLDYCNAVMPNEYIPYNLFTFRMVGTYYAAGANDKAKTLTKTLFDQYAHDANYYLSLKPEILATYAQEIQQALAIMNALVEGAKQNNETQLANELNARFQPIVQKFESKGMM